MCVLAGGKDKGSFKDTARDRTGTARVVRYRTSGSASLVPVLASRLPHVHRTCGCVVNLPHNRTCGVASLDSTSILTHKKKKFKTEMKIYLRFEISHT